MNCSIKLLENFVQGLRSVLSYPFYGSQTFNQLFFLCLVFCLKHSPLNSELKRCYFLLSCPPFSFVLSRLTCQLILNQLLEWKKWKFILQTSLCLELLAVYVGRILPDVAFCVSMRSKGPRLRVGCVIVHRKSLRVSNIVGYYLSL